MWKSITFREVAQLLKDYQLIKEELAFAVTTWADVYILQNRLDGNEIKIAVESAWVVAYDCIDSESPNWYMEY